MGEQLSLKAAMPLAEILATCRKNVSNTGPRPFVRGVHRSTVDSSLKGSVTRALMYSLMLGKVKETLGLPVI